MKKKLFYLFAALLVMGMCLFVACNEGFMGEGNVCYCAYDGKYPRTYDYNYVKDLGLTRCSELEGLLQKNEPDHKVACRMISEKYADEMLENASGK